MEAGSITAQSDEVIIRDPEDVILLTVIRCIGLFYGYYQIQLLCNLGSKYTLAITSIFPLIGSILFTSLAFLLPEEFDKIPEVLFYFLLILDLPRAFFLASIALQSSECCKIGTCSSSIFQGVKILAPWLSMDTVIECVVLLLGYYSGIPRLEALCTFVCLSVLINYVVVLAVFPLALRIIHELINTSKETNMKDKDNPSYVEDNLRSNSDNSNPSSCSKIDQLLLSWGEKSIYIAHNLPTEVCQLIQPSSIWLRGKILSAVILALAYVFGSFPCLIISVITSEFIWFRDVGFLHNPLKITGGDFPRTLWISISVDQLVVLSVAAALTVRYLFFDDKAEAFRTVSEESTTTTTTTVNTVYLDSGISTGAITAQTIAGNSIGAPACTSSANSTISTSTPVPTPSQRRRKMPVNAKEIEILLNRNNLCAEKNNVNDYHDTCSSPDSGISKSRPSSGSVTPITFSIGDHSESDDEGDSEDSGLVMKTENAETQTMLENLKISQKEEMDGRWTGPPRPLEECINLLHSDVGVKQLSDEEVINLVNAKHIPAYQLEKAVQDLERGVAIRRKLSCMQKDIKGATPDIPYKNYDYTMVQGACCENVIGYIPIPVGIAGPLKMDGKLHYVPMATTEGCLVASTNRGCRAFMQTGVRTRVVHEGMSRAPVVRFPSAMRAAEAMLWLGESENFEEVKQSFDASSRFARLIKIHPRIAGRYLFIRFVAKTGDAMGMNMISKGTEVALQVLQNHFHDMEILALSGNVCTDKKPSAINWLEGRGKSVVSEAIVPANIVENVLKTTTAALVELNIAKNLVGSAAAGSIGGFNAHAANIVTAIYIACGQDPAQNVCSSNCMTIMEPSGEDGRDLFISCTMPSIECGTIGGGTILPPQAACLDMLGVKGANTDNPGENARTFARIVSAAVLAGELSLMSALAAGHLVKSHLKHNRSATLLSAIALEQQAANLKITSESIQEHQSRSSKLSSEKVVQSIKSKLTPVSSSTILKPENTLNTKGEAIKRSPSSKSSPVITTMEFLSVPDCKQT